MNIGCSSSAAQPAEPTDPVLGELTRRTEVGEDLADTSPGEDLTRDQTVDLKYRSIASGAISATIRANAMLGADALERSSRVLDRWLTRIDPETGLFPKGSVAEDQVWDYADAGADLYPHLLIASALLKPEALPALSAMIGSERSLSGPGKLAETVNLTTNKIEPEDEEDRIYGSVEYAKDGLLPMVERLGAGPWKDRIVEIAQIVDGARDTQTRFGPIPSNSGEVNGQDLQVLSRLYWMTGNEAFFQSGERLARAYLEAALPDTDWIPLRTWDFKRERSNTRQAQIRDHGNEIVAGLVEFHLIESIHGSALTATHRDGIRSMLDALLIKGRTPQGMWKSTIDFETGQALKDTLSDNWGYIYSVYLTQAMIEDSQPGGEPARAQRYREEAIKGLTAASTMELYPWQGTEQDGYADTIESALYLLNSISSPQAERWVDRQMGTLAGAQDAEGRVEDRYLDGNYIRTSLLYAAWQSQGLRLEPWEPDVMIGAVRSGECVIAGVSSEHDWSGQIVFDAPRHSTNLGLPINYPRLNAWPEWFTVDAAQQYSVTDRTTAVSTTYSGATLQSGLAATLQPGETRELQVCPSTI